MLAAAIVWASGLPAIVAMFLYAGVYQSLFPSTVSWRATALT